MDNRIMALCELSNDLLYHKIPEHQLLMYLDEPLRLGREAAKRLQGRNIEELYEENQIEIRYQEDGKGAFGMAYRGEITLAKEGCSVVVFESSIRTLAEHSRGDEGQTVTCEQARQIHLAHEFFHFLEFSSDQFVSRMMPAVVTMEVFGFKRKACINRCSEIAAHAFAKELLSLPVLPNYYDYRYLIGTGQMTEAGFEQMIASKKQRLEALV